MSNRNPAKSPWLLAGIVLIGVIVGLVFGLTHPAYPGAVSTNALIGGGAGLLLGALAAMICDLVASLYD